MFEKLLPWDPMLTKTEKQIMENRTLKMLKIQNSTFVKSIEKKIQGKFQGKFAPIGPRVNENEKQNHEKSEIQNFKIQNSICFRER